MKKYFLGTIAVIIAILTTASTSDGRETAGGSEVSNSIHLVYMGGTQSLVGNYSQQISPPSTCAWWNRLCWLRCTDYNTDGTISQTEFDALFLTLDEDGDNTLNDETELPGLFGKKL